jgi:hypothetical protein
MLFYNRRRSAGPDSEADRDGTKTEQCSFIRPWTDHLVLLGIDAEPTQQTGQIEVGGWEAVYLWRKKSQK